MRSPRWLFVYLSLFLVILASAGLWFSGDRERTLRAEVAADLLSVARLKADQVAMWRADRLSAVQEAVGSPFFRKGVADYMVSPDPVAEADLRERLVGLQARYHLRDVLILDADGGIRARVGRRRGQPDPRLGEAIAAAASDGIPHMTDLHTSLRDPSPHVEFVAPLRDDAGRLVGSLVLVEDARTALYPLVRTWPVASATAEALLVRLDRDRVTILSDVRRRDHAALSLQVPLARTDVALVHVARGADGVVEGKDYAGHAVLSVGKSVPETGWVLVAHVHVDEALAGWSIDAVLIAALLFLTILVVVALHLFAWQRGQKRHFRDRLEAESALRRVQGRFHTSLLSVGDGVIVTDTLGRVQLMNPEAERLTGFSAQDALGRPLPSVYDVVDEVAHDSVESPAARVLRERAVVATSNHCMLRSKDGSTRPIAQSGAPIREGSDLTGVVLVFRDQTAERAARRALERSEALLAEAQRLAELGHFELDLQARTWRGSPGLDAVLGIDPSWPRTWDAFFTLVSAPERPAVAAWFAGFGQREEARDRELTIVRPSDGAARRIHVRVRAADDGGRLRVLGTAQDVTERVAARSRIERQSRMLAGVGDVNRLIVHAKDPVELLRETCDALVETESYAAAVTIRSDAEGAPVAWAQRGVGPVFARLAEELADGRLPRCCLEARASDGGRSGRASEHCDGCGLAPECSTYAACHAACLRHEGELFGCLLVFDRAPAADWVEGHDLFGGLKADLSFGLYSLAVRSARDQARAERDGLEAQLRVAQKLEAVGRLAGGVAHDFNNLLTVIINLANLNLASIPREDLLHGDLSEIRAAGERGAGLTRQLLAFSRRQILEERALTLGSVVKAFEPMLRRVIGEDVELVVELDPEPWITRADPGQLEQALMNLVINARDAMPQGGRITIRTANAVFDRDEAQLRGLPEPGAFATLTVSDTGHGMDEEVRERIFEPFFTTKEVGRGTGLGLAMVYGIVTQSGGGIRVASEVGRGSTFELSLPVCGGDVEEAAPVKPGAAFRGAAATILVVEDEDIVRRATRRILEAAGYDVIAAADGEEALELLQRHQGAIDVLLSDVVMPRMGGPALAERASRLFPGLPVVLMSGYAEGAGGLCSEDLARVLQKPFDQATLLEYVAQALAHDRHRIPGRSAAATPGG